MFICEIRASASSQERRNNRRGTPGETPLVQDGPASSRAAMKDFWISCGHHLLDRDQRGGLLVTDEFIKAYLARPELTPPAACVVERTIHAALLANPRRPVDRSE